MYRNKGTKEGTIEEKNFTVELNKKDKIDLWKKLNVENDIETIFAIHVRTKKFGKGEKLLKYDFQKLPNYIKNNKSKYERWLD